RRSRVVPSLSARGAAGARHPWPARKRRGDRGQKQPQEGSIGGVRRAPSTQCRRPSRLHRSGGGITVMARKFFLSRTLSEGRVLTRPGELLPEPLFLRALSLERKRAERSGKRFLLMLIDFGNLAENGDGDGPRTKTVAAVLARIRETDIAGWYAANGILGVIFTELGDADERLTLPILRGRLSGALESALKSEERQRLGLSFHWFPDDALPDRGEPTMYPDLTQRD